MNLKNHFQFANNPKLSSVTGLRATMSDFSYGRHTHEEYSLGVTLKGRQDFFCRNAFYKSQAGGIILFNPEDVHDGHSGLDQEIEYVMLYIHPNEFKPLFNTLGYNKGHTLRLDNNLLDDPTLRNQILSLSQLMHQSQHSKIECETALFHIAHSLVRLNGSLDIITSSKSRKDSLLLRAKDFIIANLEQDICIDNIAQEVNMSKYHFIRQFRIQFGITPHQYVLSCRINQARKALEVGLTSSQAALDSGFADSSHLNRRFKLAYGITPKQYQMQYSQ